MRFKYLLPIAVLLLLLAGCLGSGEAVFETSPLERASFVLPADGTPNDNGSIGPFCCTGVTAVVESNAGAAVGYAYFYSWKGQAYQVTPTTSVAPDASILIAGLADIEDPRSPLVKGEIDFTAAEMEVGASKSATIGQLHFTATIEAVTVTEHYGPPYFDMDSLAVRIDVGVTP
jgi:hypothetical protein